MELYGESYKTGLLLVDIEEMRLKSSLFSFLFKLNLKYQDY